MYLLEMLMTHSKQECAIFSISLRFPRSEPNFLERVVAPFPAPFLLSKFFSRDLFFSPCPVGFASWVLELIE